MRADLVAAISRRGIAVLSSTHRPIANGGTSPAGEPDATNAGYEDSSGSKWRCQPELDRTAPVENEFEIQPQRHPDQIMLGVAHWVSLDPNKDDTDIDVEIARRSVYLEHGPPHRLGRRVL
ncbi:hypothetical protein N185_17175 [Sinorhizobium sp. GW3]|nr:hypothetical protein N185_17175 [Sinorhizobium sp. GW3]